MPQLTAFELDDGTQIWVETTKEIDLPTLAKPESEEEALISKDGVEEKISHKFEAIQNMIRSFTLSTLNSFEQVSNVNIDKIRLEFGVEIGGEAGIPYLTKGTAKSNLKITVECSFPRE